MNVVILDDSATVLLTIQALLEDLGLTEGEIHPFKNGFDALEYIENNGANIIFSDIQMPDISGYEFVGKLLELSRKFVPTLFVVSADENFQSISKMKEIGAKRFIRKPINAHHFNHFVAPEIMKIRKRMDAGPRNSTSAVTPLPGDETVSPPVLNLDYECLAEKIGISAKYIPRLVESFIKEAKMVMESLEIPVREKQFDEIVRHAHSLKGSAGNMKFDDLYELAKMVELAAMAEDESFPYPEYYNAIKQGLAPVL